MFSFRGRYYYGWSIVGVAALAMVGTLPGRTQGLGLITEPLLRDLHLERLAVTSGAFGVAVLPELVTVGEVIAWAALMGVAGGVVMVLFFSVWPAVFGRRHLGQIQGAAQSLTVLASASGPVLLAWCVEATGSYAAMFRILSVVIALVAVAALLVRLPRPADLLVPGGQAT